MECEQARRAVARLGSSVAGARLAYAKHTKRLCSGLVALVTVGSALPSLAVEFHAILTRHRWVTSTWKSTLRDQTSAGRGPYQVPRTVAVDGVTAPVPLRRPSDCACTSPQRGFGLPAFSASTYSSNLA